MDGQRRLHRRTSPLIIMQALIPFFAFLTLPEPHS